MGDAERFKTTNNMYSIFSVPDHQNAQARWFKLINGMQIFKLQMRDDERMEHQYISQS